MVETHDISWSLAPARIRQALSEMGIVVSEKRLKRMKQEEHAGAAATKNETESELGSAEELLEAHALQSESLLETQDYVGAALEADHALYCLPFIKRAALARGRARLRPALNKMVEEDELPTKGVLDEAWCTFQIAKRTPRASNPALAALH